MMRSLSSAVAGLRAHQTKMDVIGNNIANVNTYGFKSSRTIFSDVYYQTLSGGAGPSDVAGGSNPTQIGYGAKVSNIDRQDTISGPASTDNPFDLYISGDGFITVQKDGATFYTRLGRLGKDAAGNIVDGNGYNVQGIEMEAIRYTDKDADGKPISDPTGGKYVTYLPKAPASGTDPEIYELSDLKNITLGADAHIWDILTNVTIDPSGMIYGTLTDDVPATGAGSSTKYPGVELKKNETYVIGNIALARFNNSEGLVQVGNSYLQAGINSGTVSYVRPQTKSTGATESGYLESANVDISKEFTDMITTQRGFQANTRIITVSDEMLQELVNLKR